MNSIKKSILIYMINENLFDICYKEAKNNNIDIIEFSGFESYNKLLKISDKLPTIPFMY